MSKIKAIKIKKKVFSVTDNMTKKKTKTRTHTICKTLRREEGRAEWFIKATKFNFHAVQAKKLIYRSKERILAADLCRYDESIYK